ncbi:MAG TPA: cellulose binding domain-containing protein [Terracidiphilus sp.]|nr:cellulose binding domain-containing protein [Terracidiphilus sp.]
MNTRKQFKASGRNGRISLRSTIVLAALCVGILAMPRTTAAQSSCSQFDVTPLDGGVYNFQMNEFDSSLQECATINGIGFTITTANFNNATNGSPATYTSVYRGCHWGTCTSSNPFPIEENNIASATSSVSITQPSGYNNDAAYDIWFNQTSTTSGQPNGTEIMIWLNHQGSIQPFGSQVSTVTIDGANWAVWTGNQSSWKIVSYVADTPVTSVSNLNLLPFFSDAVSRGSLQTSWWLIDVEYGFEIWTGGQNLATSNFSVSAAAGNGGSCSTVPSAPSGLRGTAASSSTINLSWTADTAPANCTISGYNVYRSTTSGFTPSSSNQIASGVTATSYSDTGLAASTAYYYAIKAIDAAGSSNASAQASATTQSSGGGGGTCTVDYSISNSWSGGFGASISIKNNGTTAISSWALAWTFANGQTITQFWNGVESQNGATVTVKNESYNGSIPAGGTVTGLGFNGTWNNSTNAIPSVISLNGTACTVN